MARDLPELDSGQSEVSPSRSDGSDSKTGLLDRRSYLKLAGVTTVLGGIGLGTAASADYDVITLDPGERRVIRLDDGETFENVRFDQRADGAAASVVAYGTNWTIRNVAFVGEFGHQDRAIGVADTGGGTSTIENVYMGDGVESGVGNRRHPKFGIWVSPDHSGHIDFDRIYVQGAHDNAFYASAPGSNGNGRRGTVHFKNCYAKDNWVAGFRLAGGVVENCVAVNTPAGRNGRPLWVWNTDKHDGRVEVLDSDFIAGSYPHALDIGRAGGSCAVYVENTRWSGGEQLHANADVEFVEGDGNGTNPTDRVPEGCPASADAVFEGRSTETEPSLDRTLELSGQFAYRLEVDGEIRPANDHAQWLAEGEAYGDGWAEWWLSGSADARTVWEFTGEITSLDISAYDGDIDVRTLAVDGTELDSEEYVDAGPHTLELSGQFAYRLEVDGEIEPAAAHARWLAEGEAYGEDWAEWWLSGSADARTAWEFTGEITSLEIDDYAGETDVRTLAVDGQRIDPSELST